jgi:osmotically-inducible protein OsmY
MKSDTQLQRDVIAELGWQPAVHATDIGVEVKDGVVTLAGQVGSYLEKFDIERLVQRVGGVKALAVDLEVKLPALGARDDADIARAVKNALEWMAEAVEGGVKVMVEDGWVTLSGQVDWQYQKVAAADHIRHLMGVTGVSNQIAIQPKVSLRAVKAEIEAALVRCAQADAGRISVRVNGNDITLGGSVESWAERDAARETAWATPGVQNVIDRMHSAY